MLEILPASWKEGRITLIHKLGKDPTQTHSYRPITLLNTNYKMLTKVLAERMEQVLTEYIHLEQTGFLRTSQMTNNIRRVINLINHVQLKEEPTGFYLIDAKKVFDRLEWELIKCLIKKS